MKTFSETFGEFQRINAPPFEPTLPPAWTSRECRTAETIPGAAKAFIARMENFKAYPQLVTLLKLLRPLGKTLAVVPISAVDKEQMAVGNKS